METSKLKIGNEGEENQSSTNKRKRKFGLFRFSEFAKAIYTYPTKFGVWECAREKSIRSEHWSNEATKILNS